MRLFAVAAAASLAAACGGSVSTTPETGSGAHSSGSGNGTTTGWGGAGNGTTTGWGGAGNGTTTGWGGAGNGTTTGWGGAGNGTTTGWGGAGNGTTTGWGGAGNGTTTGWGGAGNSTTTGSGGAEICADFGDPCTTCASTACPAVFCACVHNAECLALSACFNNCADAACEQACQTDHASGISDLYLLSGCAGTNCPSECPGAQPISGCTECIVDTCSDAFNTCLADAECVALYQCLTACDDFDLVCQQTCYADHGAGTAKLQALLQCQAQPCAPVCP